MSQGWCTVQFWIAFRRDFLREFDVVVFLELSLMIVIMTSIEKEEEKRERREARKGVTFSLSSLPALVAPGLYLTKVICTWDEG